MPIFGLGFLPISSIEFAQNFFSKRTKLVLRDHAIKSLGYLVI